MLADVGDSSAWNLVFGTAGVFSFGVLPCLVALLEPTLPILWDGPCKTLSILLIIHSWSRRWICVIMSPIFGSEAVVPTQVRRVSCWMCMYGSQAPKRQYAWANARSILRLDVGWRRMVSTIKTCVTYVDKSGQKKYNGSAALKSTEFLVDIEKLFETKESRTVFEFQL